MDNGGLSFAPTADNALQGARNGQLAGVPQAIQVLSLALPRVLGAPPIPASLLSGGGAHGVQSALLNTLMKTLGINPATGFPGGTAGPNPPWMPPGGSSAPPTSGGAPPPIQTPSDPGIPPLGPFKPRIVPIEGDSPTPRPIFSPGDRGGKYQ